MSSRVELGRSPLCVPSITPSMLLTSRNRRSEWKDRLRLAETKRESEDRLPLPNEHARHAIRTLLHLARSDGLRAVSHCQAAVLLFQKELNFYGKRLTNHKIYWAAANQVTASGVCLAEASERVAESLAFQMARARMLAV